MSRRTPDAGHQAEGQGFGIAIWRLATQNLNPVLLLYL